MPDTPTPGQRAYQAYSAALPRRSGWTQAAWTSLDVRVQHAWEAAAQAAIAAWWRDHEKIICGEETPDA